MSETVLITGATSGIGYEFTKLFAKKGYKIIAMGRSEKKLENLQIFIEKEYSAYIKTIKYNLANINEINRLSEEVKNMDIDIFINNAGFNVYGKFSETDFEEELNMINVNIIALTKLTKIIGQNMLKRGNGKILNMGSTGSFVPGPYNSVYCASKAYVYSFSQALAKEFENTRVSVTTLCPGATDTNFAKNANMVNIPLFKSNVMKAEEVATIGYKALMKNKRFIIAGIKNKAMILFSKFVPQKLILNITENMMR